MRWFLAVLYVFGLLAQPVFAGDKPRIVTDILPVYDITKTIVGDYADVSVLVPSFVSEHLFNLKPSDIEKLYQADAIVVVSGGLIPELDHTLRGLERKTNLIEILHLDGIKPLPFREENPFINVESPHDEHQHSGVDPHLWLDPTLWAAVAQKLATQLGKTMPEHAALFQHRANTFAQDVNQKLLPAIQKSLGTQATNSTDVVPYITYHDAYQYFEKRFQIDASGFLTTSPEESKGANKTAQLQKAAGEKKIGCIITETQNALVDRIAESSGAEVMMIDPISGVFHTENKIPDGAYHYSDAMLGVAQAFGHCLAKAARK